MKQKLNTGAHTISVSSMHLHACVRMSVVCDVVVAPPPAAIVPPVPMPPACRCRNGGTCYTDEGGLPKCK